MTYLKGFESNYNKYPVTKISGYDQQAFKGYESIVHEVTKQLTNDKNILVVDCTVGVNNEEIIAAFANWSDVVIDAIDIYYDYETMNKMLRKNVTDDRVFGVAYHGKWFDFVDLEKLDKVKKDVAEAIGNVLIIGVGATYIHDGDVLVFADMTIWEIQMRYRDGLDNFNCHNFDDETTRKFKRGYFVDWRLSNFHKDGLMKEMNYYLDTVIPNEPKMVSKEAFDGGLLQLLNQPFSLEPFFDAGLWGGQWMKEVLDIEDKEKINYAWSYNLLFPENCVALDFNDIKVSIPGYTVCRKYPKELIGERGYARFGAEYPIRYDYLDTMEGGNLSLQVHPTNQYFHENFALPFTQDESYYFLDCAEEETYMYLGIKDGVTREDMESALLAANRGEAIFDAEKYANKIPVKKHEHYHIPSGTVHCSGADTMVLEISSAPCIFTFKLWDWGRVGMDGKPRPIHIERGVEVIKWDKGEKWMRETCAFKPILIEEGEGWKEEKTGLHDLEFIETRRVWTSVKTTHKTNGETHALNLVEGREALIESPSGQFKPFTIHFAESVVIPALIKEYTITPCGDSFGKEIGIIKGYVRY